MPAIPVSAPPRAQACCPVLRRLAACRALEAAREARDEAEVLDSFKGVLGASMTGRMGKPALEPQDSTMEVPPAPAGQGGEAAAARVFTWRPRNNAGHEAV